MAAKFLNGQSGRIIIATDGVVDSGNRVDQLVDQLYKTVGRIDFISLDGVEFASDVLLEPIKGSTNVWSEMKFPIFLPVHSILKQECEWGTLQRRPSSARAGRNYRTDHASGWESGCDAYRGSYTDRGR